MNIVKPVHAQIPLGNIEGVGELQSQAAIRTPTTALEGMVSTVVGALTGVAGIAFLIYFILGGLTWITAGGEQDKVKKAQKQMTDALIGLIAVIVAYFIAAIVGTVLDIPILDPFRVLSGTSIPGPGDAGFDPRRPTN